MNTNPVSIDVKSNIGVIITIGIVGMIIHAKRAASARYVAFNMRGCLIIFAASSFRSFGMLTPNAIFRSISTAVMSVISLNASICYVGVLVYLAVW